MDLMTYCETKKWFDQVKEGARETTENVVQK